MSKSGFSPLFFMLGVFFIGSVQAQTTSTTSGNWNDGTVWSTGTVPAGTTNTTVNHPITINQNIAISSGDYTINSNVTDLPGGTAHTLSVGANGILDVYGYMVFEGAGTTAGGGANFATVIVRAGGTLVLGGGTLFGNKSIIIVEAGGTLIINGDLTIDDNQGSFTISGSLQVYGNVSIPQGNIQIDGTGDVFTTGTIFSTGSSTIYGSTGDCDTGPCSGRNLCSTFDNGIGSDQILCSGSTPSLLTNQDNSGVSGSAVISWEQSTTSSTSGYSTISGATALTYQPPALTATTWFRRVITDAGCTGTSAPVQITIIPGGGWIGTTSDWNTTSNWCSNTVPTATTDVEINPGVPFQPVISAGAVCRNLTINVGASVTISGSNTLDLKGNLTNNGTLTVNTSTVNLTGTTTQTISGTSINIFNNLTINNTSGLTPAIALNGINNVGVNNALVMTAGVVNLNGYNLTVGSSTASPGSITYTGGRFYGGNLMRWFDATSKAIGASSGLFPVGTGTDYRPMYIGHSALTTGGTIRVSHTGIAGSTDVAFNDDVPVQKRSNSFWNIATANGLNVGTNAFSLRVEGTGFGTIQEVTDLRLTQASTAPGAPGVNAGTITNPQVNRITTPLSAINNDVFHISSVDGANSPLPIKLKYFNATLEDDNVVLSWATEKEENFDRFIIEKSASKTEFIPIAEISGAGYTTSSEKKYSHIDPSPYLGFNYYRLKAIDLDGTFEYFDIKSVNYMGESSVEIYPNPVTSGVIYLDVKFNPTPQDRFTIMDMQGREIFSRGVSFGLQEFDITGEIKTGLYIVRYTSPALQQTMKFFVK